MNYIAPICFVFTFEEKPKLAINESISFIKSIEKIYSIKNWISDSGKGSVAVDETGIRKYIYKTAKRQGNNLSDNETENNKLSATWGVSSTIDYSQRIGTSVSIGHKSHFLPDSFSLEIAPGIPFPEHKFARDTICRLDAIDFHIETHDFQENLEEYGIVYPRLTQQISRRPLHLFWQNYFNAEVIDLLGGMNHCLQTPAFLVEPFHKGIFIQLTEKPFEPGNEQQMQALLKAMKHLKIPQ